MPYRKRGLAQYSPKHRRGRRTGHKNMSLSKTIRREVFKLAEPKYLQTDLTTTVSYNGSFQSLALVDQGDYATKRVGNKVIPTSWTIRGSMTGSDNFNFIRMVVFQWHDDNAINPPGIDDIFENTTGSTSALYSTFNRQHIGSQFHVLSDRLMRVSANALNPDINSARIITNMKGWKGLKEITFQGSSTYAFNQLYILMISDSSTINHPAFDGYAVVNYRDL